MEGQRKYILQIDEIQDGYLLHVTNSNGENIQTRSFQWAACNNQRMNLVQEVINRLGMKHDVLLTNRRT